MERLYDFQPPAALDWLGHGHGHGKDGSAGEKQQAGGGAYASLLKPLTRLVRESLDTVHNVTEALGSFSVGGYAAGFSEEQLRFAEEQQERLIQMEKLRAARAHGEWVKAAQELDRLDGCDEWKAVEESEDYDVEALKRKLADLEAARDNEDLARMLRLIRTDLGRDVAGMGNPRLYEYSRVGTKDLIERYVSTAVDTIESAMRLAACRRDGRIAETVRQSVVEARQAYGRTGLLLSGGGTMGMMHIGVVKAMFEAGVLPRVISGASAGSIVAAVICTKTDDEVPAILDEFCGDLDVFTKGESDARWSSMMYRLFTKGSLYDIKNLEDVMYNHVKDMTFQEAYNRTQRILSVAVSHENAKDEPLVLNYATAPHVLIRSAVAASCSVPFIYRPAPIFERNPRTREITRFGGDNMFFIDGSVSHDIPLGRLRAMLDVNHFIVSQVNPHIVPFLRKAHTGSDVHPSERSWTDTFTELARTEVVCRLHQLSEIPIPVVRKLVHMGSSMLEQTYTGDITILPETSFGLEVLTNPTPAFMVQAMEKGERATWPEIDRIERRTAVERAIDRSIRSALERVAFSDSQVDLRLSRIRKESTAERLRGRRTRAAHRTTASMVLPDPQSIASYPPSIIINRSRSSSEDGTASRSPSLLPGLTSSSPPPSDTDESEADDDDDSPAHAPFLRPRKRWPPNWPYGSASQPATPSAASASKTFNFSPSPRSSSPGLTHSHSLAMTPSTPQPQPQAQAQAAPPRPPSSPELRYKRLFHGVKNSFPRIGSKSPEPEPRLVAADEREGKRAGSGSGSFLAKRGRRSTSTGMRGLNPPGRR
ncbi:hypothetical protein WHR41_03953 [Cladosporium halotolerans]|uniref:Patatin-like phospholipase domain-containing protein n=1 Tax=Cladosporium halotolerans TaxID=1052096 RepID=A0AB34KV12_9PEZI